MRVTLRHLEAVMSLLWWVVVIVGFGVPMVIVCLMIFSQTAQALEIPTPGPLDPRIRYVDYSPNQVVKLTGFYGFTTIIVFGDETVKTPAPGFPAVWDIVNKGHYITLQPKWDVATDKQGPVKPDDLRVLEVPTNLVIETDKRMYVFDLAAKQPSVAKSQARDPEQIYLLRFRYPDDERRAAEMAQAQLDAGVAHAAAQAANERQRAAAIAALPPRPRNTLYFWKGAESLLPYRAWDDGRFTYFQFWAQQDLPAVYIVSPEDGTPVLANKHFEYTDDGEVMVIEHVGRQLQLRKKVRENDVVACIFNKNPELFTPQPTTGSTEPGGQRLIKGQR